MNHISAPPARSLFDDWTFARALLMPAIERLHGVSENDVLAGVISGRYILKLGKRSAMLVQNEFYGDRKALNFYAAGGDKDELLEMQDAMCADAPAHGYTLATARGRKGWEKFVTARGWKFDYIAMYKELV